MIISLLPLFDTQVEGETDHITLIIAVAQFPTPWFSSDPENDRTR